MAKALRRLDPSAFVRIHRSAIVNIDRIKGLIPWSHGEYVVTLRDGTRLHANRVYSQRLNEVIESCCCDVFGFSGCTQGCYLDQGGTTPLVRA
ncbi:MAG: LytTR family DNA-binding domain-containing protein [Gemmatimonadaceae bacterium]